MACLEAQTLTLQMIRMIIVVGERFSSTIERARFIVWQAIENSLQDLGIIRHIIIRHSRTKYTSYNLSVDDFDVSRP
jgi:hypothetical protein